jgi:hypothetical protein
MRPPRTSNTPSRTSWWNPPRSLTIRTTPTTCMAWTTPGRPAASSTQMWTRRRPGTPRRGIRARSLQYVDEKANLAGKTVTGGRLNLVRALTQNADVTKPAVTLARPAPDSSTRDTTPTLVATVRDDRTELTKNDVRFYLDGQARGTFSYDAGTDRLSFTSGKLSYARHAVKIVARDAAGNVSVQTWRFRVVR